MKDKKKKKGVAVIISIGPKMPKKPMDAATPDMKKYGSMPMKKSWQTLKALPEHQMFEPAYPRSNLAEDTYQGEGPDVGERQEGAGTIHPAIYAMMQRRMKENPDLTSGSYNDKNADLPNLNLRANESALYYNGGKTPMLDMHPEYYADSMPYGSLTDDPMDAYANKDNQRRTKAPQSYSYQQTHPTNKEVQGFKDDYAPFLQNALKNTELGKRAASEAKLQELINSKMLHRIPSRGKPMQKALKILKNSDLRQALANAPDNYALDEVMDATDDYRRQEVEERYARMKAKKDRKIPQRPSPYFPASFPEDKPQELEQPNDNGPYSQIFEDLPQRSVFGKAFEMLKQNYTRDSMPPPRRYDDEGFPEYDGEDLGPPYGKPEFGDEDARQAEMNEAERAAIEAEGMPEMRRPRSAPRPGDPRFADPNKPRPRMPKNVFANR